MNLFHLYSDDLHGKTSKIEFQLKFAVYLGRECLWATLSQNDLSAFKTDSLKSIPIQVQLHFSSRQRFDKSFEVKS